MNKRPLGSFQLFALCALSSALGIFVTTGEGFSPAFFWLATGLFMLQSFSVWLLGRSFKHSGSGNAFSHLSGIFTSHVARIVTGLLGVLLVLRSAITLSAQTNCIALYLLEETPDFAIMLVLLLTAFGALLPGLRRLSGVSSLLTLILPVFIFIIVACGLASADYRQLRVLVQPAPEEFPHAFVPAALTVSGGVCTLFFLGHQRAESNALKGAVLAPALCGLVFILLSLTAVGTIGQGGMSKGAFPLVEASRQISLGGIELTERFDLPLITAGLFASIVQMAIFNLCAAMTICFAFNSQRVGRTAAWLLPIQFTASLFVQYTDFAGILQWICAVGLTVVSVILFPLTALMRSSSRQEKTV